MRSPWIRRIAIALGVLLLLLVLAATVLVATFDANRYKGLAIDWMKKERDRTLAIDGPIGLSVFPRIEVTVSKLKLSERARPKDEFLAIDDAALALDLMPLLRKQLVVDRVQASGVRVRLTRDAKGVRNTDDLAGAPPPAAAAPAPTPAGPAMRFDVSGVKLDNVRVSVRDDAAQIAGDALVESLVTGRIGHRVESPVELKARLDFAKPKLKGNVSGKTRLALDLDSNAVSLADVKLAWDGDAFDVNLSAKALAFDPKAQQIRLDTLALALAAPRDGQPLKVALDWPQLEASASSLKGSALSGSVSLAGTNKLDAKFRSGAPTGNFDELKLPQLALDIAGASGPRTVKAKLSSNLTVRPNQQAAVLDALALDAQIVEPGLQPLTVSARGNANASATAAAWTLAGSLNDNRFDIAGNASFAGAVPNVKVQAKFDALDLNRLIGTDKAQANAPAAADKPIEFTALKSLNGQFGFGARSLAFRQYRVADMRLDATLDNGVLRVPKLAGRTWGGSIDASGSADAKGNRLAVKLAANGVDVNALLKDVAGKDLLEGTGRVTADLTTSGTSTAEFRSRLAGTAQMNVRDGAIKGYNLARGLRQAKAALSMKQDAVAQAKQTEKTDFSELSASARIEAGVARSDDLELKSPFLRVGGAGQFDIGRGRIDYTAKATVTDTTRGQDGAELAALKGVTVPVRLTGPFEAIDWQIQWSGVAAAAIENRLKDKLAEKLGIAVPQGGEAASAPQRPKDRLKDALKGFLR